MKRITSISSCGTTPPTSFEGRRAKPDPARLWISNQLRTVHPAEIRSEREAPLETIEDREPGSHEATVSSCCLEGDLRCDRTESVDFATRLLQELIHAANRDQIFRTAVEEAKRYAGPRSVGLRRQTEPLERARRQLKDRSARHG